MIDPIKHYKIEHVAEMLGVSRATVKGYIDSGELRARQIRPGAHMRIAGKDLIDYVDGIASPTGS
jgi:excisionase family DNA binding protein